MAHSISAPALKAIAQPAALVLEVGTAARPRGKPQPITGLYVGPTPTSGGAWPAHWVVRRQTRIAGSSALEAWTQDLRAAFCGANFSFGANLFGASPLRLSAPIAWRPIYDAIHAVVAGLPDAGEHGFNAAVLMRSDLGRFSFTARGAYYRPHRILQERLRAALKEHAPAISDWLSGFCGAHVNLFFTGAMSAHARAAAMKDAARHPLPPAPPTVSPADAGARIAALIADGIADRIRQAAQSASIDPNALARRVADGLAALDLTVPGLGEPQRP